MSEDRVRALEVRLRRVEDPDIDVFFDHQADPAAAEMAAVPVRDIEQFVAHWADVRTVDAMVIRTILADGTVVGNIGSWQRDDQRILGYRIGREHWGRGIATQALARFLTEDEPTRPMYAYVVVHNVRSIRVLEKVGFRRASEVEAQTPPRGDGIVELAFVLDG